jgi:integrase/recombinase XerC
MVSVHHNYLAELEEKSSKGIKPFVAWMIHQKNRSLHTVDSYRRTLEKFSAFLGHYHNTEPDLERLKEATITDVRAFLSMRSSHSVQKQSNAVALSALKTYYRFLTVQGHKIHMPLHALRGGRLPRKLPRPLSIEQTRTLVSLSPRQKHWIDWRNYSLGVLLYATGLRIQEALSLNVEHWKCRDNLYILGKGGKARMIPLLKRAFSIVEYYRDLCPYKTDDPQSPLFYGARGKRLQAAIYQKYFRRMREEYNFPPQATPHSLRHSFASHLLDQEASLRDVQEMLGHQALSSTQRYTASSQKHLQDIYRAFHPDAEQNQKDTVGRFKNSFQEN